MADTQHITCKNLPHLLSIGDLHGELQKSEQALRLAGLIDSSDRWMGGSATLIQVGDVLDRGGDEIKILYFLEKLNRQAAKVGGEIVTMNGNHETMNIDAGFRFVTKSALDEFRVWADWYCVGNSMKSLCDGLEKPKDLYRGLLLVFPNLKQEISDGVRARFAVLRCCDADVAMLQTLMFTIFLSDPMFSM